MLYQLLKSAGKVLSLDLCLYHRTRKSRSEPIRRLSRARFFVHAQCGVPGIRLLRHSWCGQSMDWYPRFQTFIMDGYRLGKSITATLKCTPGVGSTTMAPWYFLPFMMAVVEVLPFLASMSSALGMSMFLFLCSRCMKFLIHRDTPWRLTSSMGMLLILAKTRISFMANSSSKLVSLKAISESLRQYWASSV